MFHHRKNLAIRIWKIVLLAVLLSTSTLCVATLLLARNAVKHSIQQRMRDIANCAAGSVSGDSLKRITINQTASAGYHNISNTLSIFLKNIEAEYVYAIRVEDDGSFTLSVDPTMDDLTEFGSTIETTEALVMASKGTPAVDDYPTSDEWGEYYSAYSPVFDSNGEIAGVIGVDFPRDWYEDQINLQNKRILLIYLLILLIFLPLIGIMCLFTIRTITRPINQLTEVASRYQQGDFSQEIEIYEEENMGILSSALQSMANSLTEQIKTAEEANKAKSYFLANMSHEIRTPINAVLGMNEMILRESSEPEIRGYSENIKSAGMTLLNLINDILDFSKIEAGKLEIEPEEYDLYAVLNDLVNMIHPRLDAKDLELKLDFDPATPKNLFGDSNRIKQVITNILTNAAKYTEKGSVTFKVGFKRATIDSDSIVLLVSVKDTGIGIKPEDMQKLFSEFERIEEKKHRNIEGTGLGMSITKRLLEMMDSALEVESTYGEGSDFHFALKQKVTGEELLGNFEALHLPAEDQDYIYKERFTAPEAHILVVDDNPMNLMVFKNLIKKTLIATDTADNGDEALIMMREKKYDIILLDHMMPGKDGIATLHEMKQQADNPNLGTPVICLTANAISGVRDEYISTGFDDYLSKPIDSTLLEDMLIKYLPSGLVKFTKDAPTDNHPAAKAYEPQTTEYPTPFQDQDLIDFKSGTENSGGKDCFMSMLEIFSNNADSNLDELNRFYSEEDFENYTIKIHALKSSSRIIGALGLADDAQNLEDAGKAGDYDQIRSAHEDYVNKFLQVTELVNHVLNQHKKNTDTKLTACPVIIKEAYAQILKSAKTMDYDTIEAVYKEMDAYAISDEDAPLWNRVKEAFHSLNYDEIVSLLNS